MKFLKTLTGKVVLVFVFFSPFFSALFFNFFEGQKFESPIGGCCLPMEGVVITGYGLFTIWILGPSLLVYALYKLYTRKKK